MSKVVMERTGIDCLNDHGFGKPCDGHTITVTHHLSSDIVSLDIDDQHYSFPDELWHAIIDMWRQYDKPAPPATDLTSPGTIADLQRSDHQ